MLKAVDIDVEQRAAFSFMSRHFMPPRKVKWKRFFFIFESFSSDTLHKLLHPLKACMQFMCFLPETKDMEKKDEWQAKLKIRHSIGNFLLCVNLSLSLSLSLLFVSIITTLWLSFIQRYRAVAQLSLFFSFFFRTPWQSAPNTHAHYSKKE